MTTTPTPVITTAKDRMVHLIIAAVTLLGIGIVIAITTKPAVEVGAFNTVETTGSQGGYAFGMCVAAVGAVLAQVWTVAMGVRIALTVHEEGK